MPVAPCHSVVQHFSLPLNESQVEAWASEQLSLLAGPVTFGLLFCAPDAVPHAREILDIVRIYAQTPVMLGCSAEGLIADARELESGEGFCVALYHLPGTQARSVRLEESLLLECGTEDFLVRNLAAIDPNTGSVAIATPPRVGQNLQFQIRDALTASVDFEELLKRRLGKLRDRQIYGACLCDCIGRGSSLFGVSNHDAGIVHRLIPGMSLSGLSCNGEFAPVAGRTRLHGYAASLGLFVSKA